MRNSHHQRAAQHYCLVYIWGNHQGTATTDGQPSVTISSAPEETTAWSGWRRMSMNSKLGSQTPGLCCGPHQSPHKPIHPRPSSWSDEFRLVFTTLFNASSFKQRYNKHSPCGVWEELTCRWSLSHRKWQSWAHSFYMAPQRGAPVVPCLEPTPGSFPQLDMGPPAASGLCGWVSKGGGGGQTHPHGVSLRGGREALPRPVPHQPSPVRWSLKSSLTSLWRTTGSLSCQPNSLPLQALPPAHIPAQCVPGQNCVS